MKRRDLLVIGPVEVHLLSSFLSEHAHNLQAVLDARVVRGGPALGVGGVGVRAQGEEEARERRAAAVAGEEKRGVAVLKS